MTTETRTPTHPTPDVTGTFAWFELRTKDPKKSLAFFGEVLGWKAQEMEMGAGKYTMLLAGETPIGGVVGGEARQGAFVSYLNVADVDAAARTVKTAGGSVIGAPVDVPTVGRMVEVKDQDGAAFFLFKSLDPRPAPKGVGTFHWNELWVKDEKRALSFLTSVVGYSVDAMPMPGATYNVLKAKSGPAGGVTRPPIAGAGTAWVPYVHVADVDRTVARAKALGGKLEGEVTDVEGVGRYAILSAPDGARFGVIAPAAN